MSFSRFRTGHNFLAVVWIQAHGWDGVWLENENLTGFAFIRLWLRGYGERRSIFRREKSWRWGRGLSVLAWWVDGGKGKSWEERMGVELLRRTLVLLRWNGFCWCEMVWAGGPSLQRSENSKRLSDCCSVLSLTVTVGDGKKGNGLGFHLVTKRVLN
jgi:hypothetical protein